MNKLPPAIVHNFFAQRVGIPGSRSYIHGVRLRPKQNPIKMFEDLVTKTQKAVDALGVDVKVTVERDDETGRLYLMGKFTQRLKFKGFDDMFVQETTLREQVFPDVDTAFRLFMHYFTPNRIAHMNATDEEVMAYEGHPCHYPIA